MLANSKAPNGRRRILVLSAAAGLLAVPVLMTAWNVAAGFSQIATNAQLRGMLAALEDRGAGPNAASADADRLARGFLIGETVGTAGAALQAEVATIVESVEAKTVETELLDPEEGSDPKDLRLRITFEAKNDALQRILLDVESNPTALYLRTLSIEPANSGDDDERSEPLLRATATIEGYWGEGGG